METTSKPALGVGSSNYVESKLRIKKMYSYNILNLLGVVSPGNFSVSVVINVNKVIVLIVYSHNLNIERGYASRLCNLVLN